MEKIKLVVFVIAIALSGIILASVSYNIINPADSYAYSVINEDCGDSECELGFICVDNPGGNTDCAKDGEECKTLGCCGGCDVED